MVLIALIVFCIGVNCLCDSPEQQKARQREAERSEWLRKRQHEQRMQTLANIEACRRAELQEEEDGGGHPLYGAGYL